MVMYIISNAIKTALKVLYILLSERQPKLNNFLLKTLMFYFFNKLNLP